jgi:hypothetical protein
MPCILFILDQLVKNRWWSGFAECRLHTIIFSHMSCPQTSAQVPSSTGCEMPPGNGKSWHKRIATLEPQGATPYVSGSFETVHFMT